jgi:hypothetical protein
LPRIKTVQNPYSLNRLYETGQPKLAIEKNVDCLFSNGFVCYQEILTGENTLKQGFICFLNIQGTTAPNVLKQQSSIRRLLKKRFANGIVIGFIEQQSD